MWDKEADKHKETLRAYDNKGEEKTSGMSEKKEKLSDDYFCMYQYDKQFFHSTYEHACAAQDTTISNMREIVEI